MLKAKWTIRAFLFTVLTFWVAAANGFQGKPIIEINQGQQTPRLAVPDFRAASSDAQTAPLNSVFNQTLWNDLDSSGVFNMVGKSFYPSQVPSQPSELKVVAWGSPP